MRIILWGRGDRALQRATPKPDNFQNQTRERHDEQRQFPFSLPLSELDARIAILRDNIRQLIEQAAGFSGAEDEERNADRIAQQTEELETLTKQRDALLKK
jgi:hypothetical protein